MEGEGDDGEKEYDVLIRCTDGLDINFATRVSRGQKPCSYPTSLEFHEFSNTRCLIPIGDS